MFTWHQWGVTWDPNLLRPPFKWSLYLSFVGCWIAAVYFNGALGRIQDNIASAFAVASAALLAAFGWLLLKSEQFRRVALRPEASFEPTVKSLRVMTWIASAIAGAGVLKLVANVA